MKFLFILLFSCICVISAAQTNSHFSIVGKVADREDTTLLLSNVTIQITPTNKSTHTDLDGHFSIENLSSNEYKLLVKYSNYNSIDTIIHLHNDIDLKILLSHSSKDLGQVIVRSVTNKNTPIISIPQTTISGKNLDLYRGLSLGETLKQIPGVNSLQSGPTISKPVIHGVYSNRILILNNGVRQEGQNWGNDHAPEIDPFIANRMTVVKGPSSLRYGSDAIGGVVLVEAPELKYGKGISGELNTVAMTNGRSGTISGVVQGGFDKKLSDFAWRVQGTLQKAGNSRAAHYYIPNTGFNQKDLSVTLGLKKKNYGVQIYGSQFNSTIGITPTSQDLTYNDFLEAIQRGRPSNVYNYFTYKLDPIGAKQVIRHNLLKADAYWQKENVGRFDFQFSVQNNLRKEFGLDPLTYTNIPDNKFNLTSYAGDLIWRQPKWINGLTGSIGISYLKQHNTIESRERTEVIPSYDNHSQGIYAIEKYSLGNFLVEGGLRYDRKYQQSHLFRRANALSNTSDTTYDSTARWNRFTTNVGLTWFSSPHFTVMYNLGTAWRGPSPIELFANGVHMGASRWEKGDPNLQVESAINNNLTFKYVDAKLNIELGLYANYFRNYIYIQPDGVIQSISGYYPLYEYKQAKRALFTGLDFDGQYNFLPNFKLESKISIVRGRNQTEDQWLIYIPADKYDNSISYQLPKLKGLNDAFISINNLFVARQTRIPTNITDAPPPPSYDLWGMTIGATTHIGKQQIDWSITATNLMNKEYKDYLNLFRYYNHDLGRNIALRLKFPF
ncbi:TonB-dependent receptor [Rhizosphaericola mali]|uniref:TonB-dependent receptor n=1 Tax=Rhizosphaericola mali TaxID=2545455 RepID=A0A5P2G3I7_9BACT|nr:TonB-dependent receptor [Rhizosphaericola mali]QES88382.1 TonB-dependent receptor [Rhizosphaericola mali]